MGYFVPTTEGQQGPFEVDQLQRFVDRGKLPLDLQVVHEDSGLRVDLSMICDEPSAEPAAAAAPPAPHTPPPAPVGRPSAAPPPPAPAPARRPQTSRASSATPGRSAGRRSAPKGRAASGRRTGSTGFQRKSSATPMIIAVLVAIVLALFAVAVARPEALFGPPPPYIGEWALDRDATAEAIILKELGFSASDPNLTDEQVLQVIGVKEAFEHVSFELEITYSSLIGTIEKPGESTRRLRSSYEAFDLGENAYRIQWSGDETRVILRLYGRNTLELEGLPGAGLDRFRFQRTRG